MRRRLVWAIPGPRSLTAKQARHDGWAHTVERTSYVRRGWRRRATGRSRKGGRQLLGQPMPEGKGDGGGTVVAAGFLEDGREVVDDRFLAQTQGVGDGA